MSRALPEPIAVVGMACRLPGASNVAEFWDLLCNGKDSISEQPPRRVDVATWDDPNSTLTDSLVSKAGGFLDDVDKFDAAFFGMSERVATRLDPQRRLLLETSWECFEDAGIPAERLAGSRTAVYAGCIGTDYWTMLRRSGIHDIYASSGAGVFGTVAGQISYVFDLRGPSMLLDSSCSTALLGVHLACAGLRHGESDLALVGAVSLILNPYDSSALSDVGVLSPGGRSRFGDADADGYVRSEGVAAVVLKRHADAVRDGDRVYAVILGSGVVNDGRSGGMMFSPGLTGQEEMLRLAYRDAGVSPRDIDYVEAHGTGTTAGDRVELSALGSVLADRPADRPLLVGSAKSNVGHTEPVAGLVGLIKTALALRHRIIPATLHVAEPNPAIDKAPIQLVTRCRPWPPTETGRPGLAGVSSFGISGTNAHVVVGEAPRSSSASDRPVRREAVMLPVSARCPQALPEVAAAYHRQLAADPTASLADLCYSAGALRTHHLWRVAVTGRDREELLDALDRLATCDTVPSAPPAAERPRVVFVFSGNGSQWPGMARELLDSEPVFAEALRRCDEAIQAECGWSVVQGLRAAEPMTEVEVNQPALWAVQVALTELWRSWGVEPDLLIGHSMGESVAAVAAGALSVSDAATVTCRRARLLRRVHGQGTMAVVQLSEAETRAAVDDERVEVAALNGDSQTVLCGPREALERVIAPLSDRGVFCRLVNVDYASHGPQVEPLREEVLAALAHLRPRAGRVPIHSTVTGTIVDGAGFDAEYWMDNLRQPVRFAPVLHSVLSTGEPTVFVEISPHPLLGSAIQDTIDATGAPAVVVGSLYRDRPQRASLLSALGSAYVAGCRPAWDRVYRDAGFLTLPTYPWQRERYWIDPPAAPRPYARSRVAEPAAAPRPVEMPTRSPQAAERYLAGRVADTLQLPAEEVDRDVPLTLFGMDSMRANEIRSRIQRDLGVAIPATMLLRGATIAQLAARLSTAGHAAVRG